MPFPKGISGNPGGRPSKSPFVDALTILLHTAEVNGTIPALPRGCTIAYLLADKLVRNALTCDNPETQLKYIRETLDRHIGRPIQPVAASVEVNVSLADRLGEAEKLAKSIVLDSVSVTDSSPVTIGAPVKAITKTIE